MGTELLSQPLTLPCGVEVKNRILKSAMSEALGTSEHAPQPGLVTLYRRWAAGGVGLCVTGNVMVDRRALGEPGNVVVEDRRDLEALAAWAAAGTQQDTQLWMQLNHPGKQCPKFLSSHTVAPSAVGFGPALSGAFAVPRALEEEEILELVGRFAEAAAVAQEAGFSGVQIHGAHGYLVSQFLSPHHNQRTDRWGGCLEHRARFVLEVYQAIRGRVGPDFPVGIKLNSADFQRGGFQEEDSLQVMTWLQEAGVDLIEVSGGTYEAPVMTGVGKRASTIAREGYFLDFISKAREILHVPLCITGGFRTPEGMAVALADGAQMVGLARTLAIQPDFPGRVLAGEAVVSQVSRLGTGVKAVDRAAAFEITWYENQLARMAQGLEPDLGLGAWRSLGSTVWRTGLQAFKRRRPKA